MRVRPKDLGAEEWIHYRAAACFVHNNIKKYSLQDGEGVSFQEYVLTAK
jgi:hypothetical protein